MDKIITDKLPELVQICEKYHVELLYLFGSAAKGELRADSDIDVLVTFGQVDLFDYFDNFIFLKKALADLFNRPVDLLEEKAIRNPILRRSIELNKQLIYGRTG